MFLGCAGDVAAPAQGDNLPPVPLPPNGTHTAITEATAVQAQAEMAARHTAGPTAPQERYYQRRSEERSSENRDPAARGRDHTPARRDDRSRRELPAQPPGRVGNSGAPMTGAGAAPPGGYR